MTNCKSYRPTATAYYHDSSESSEGAFWRSVMRHMQWCVALVNGNNMVLCIKYFTDDKTMDHITMFHYRFDINLQHFLALL
jgi:hypothetical protein